MAFNTWNKVRELADFQLPKVCQVHILCQVSARLDEHETGCAFYPAKDPACKLEMF